MTDQPYFNRYSRPLTANQILDVPTPGARSLKILSQTGSVQISFDDKTFFTLFAGFKLNSTPFSKITLKETAGATASVDLLLGEGDVDDTSVVISDPVVVNSGDTLTNKTVTVGAAATVIVAADATRNAVIITNTHATETMYVGGAAVTVAAGTPVLAGQSITLETGAAVSAIRVTNAVDARVLELKD